MMIDAKITEESTADLRAYRTIPISFVVHSVIDVELLDGSLKGLTLAERKVASPWVKDYDSCKKEGPMSWAKHWNIAKWGVISAFVRGSRVGGCVIAYDTPGVHKLEGRNDIAALWDLRVAPHCRGEGIGTCLVEASLSWARRKNCRMMKVETQNINVPACRLYAKMGFTLGTINRYAYPALPGEIELMWCKEL